MTVTALRKRQVGVNAVELRFESDDPDPTFTVWHNGACVLETKGNTYRAAVTVEGNVFEVFDGTEDTQTRNGDTVVRWVPVASAVQYRVEKNDGGWSTVATITDNGESQFEVPIKSVDDAATQWRVTAINDENQESTPAVVTVRAEKNPAPASVAAAFDNVTKLVTISEL